MSTEENLAGLSPPFTVSPDKKRQRGEKSPQKTETSHNPEINNTTKTLAQNQTNTGEILRDQVGVRERRGRGKSSKSGQAQRSLITAIRLHLSL